MIPPIRKNAPIRNNGNRKNPGKNPRCSSPTHVHDLDLLAVVLGDLHLLDALGDPVAFARVVGADPDADPREEHHQHCHDPDTTTHVVPPRLASASTLAPRCEAFVNERGRSVER
jgi:hypothetical protein